MVRVLVALIAGGMFFFASRRVLASDPAWEAVARLRLGWKDASAGVEERPCSGFVIAGSRLVTCEHCVMDGEGCGRLEAEFLDGSGEVVARARCGRLSASDRTRDIAVLELRVTEGSLPQPLTLARQAPPPGSAARLVGYPLYAGRGRAVAEGRTSAPPNAWADSQYHSVQSGPGNSGSPLLDAQTGEVLSLHCASTDWGGLRLGYGASASSLQALAR